MEVVWTASALGDAERLFHFLAQHDRAAAIAMATRLDAAPEKLIANPRLGERVEAYASKEVRKLSVGRYVMHYEVADGRIVILRLWHGREERR